MKLNITVLLLMIIIIVISCADKNTGVNELAADDKSVISSMIKEYNEAWLKDDSATIMGLFADTAILIPSGMDPIQGKKAIVNFWWPNDSSQTKINNYKINILEINGNRDLAYTLEEGKLEWSYKKAADKFSQKQKSYEITIFRKANKQWKITKRIWTDQVLK